ncbi:GTP-binding protein [Candidatus Dojkabacteria bacterium]|uniref:GTP-binding protein n=1 Tax=Candidatus Dojkabacteria bacterium TaxID=2099670 RepID=A0A3M0Z1D4_9BACT|nr:MAG: GTP-binding protein [Candidatus Dojkabacteria bacterium]
MKKVPVSIVTGFLGSGKTTFINKIIKQNQDLKLGVLLNEFGEVALESQFLIRADEEVVELPNGCVCCVSRGELLAGLEKIIQAKPDTDYIIIEASGLSDPLPLMLTFYSPIFATKFILDAIIGVVDYVNFQSIMDIYDIARHQIHFSNLVIVTKSKPGDDLSQINELVHDINPKALIFQDSENLNTVDLLDKYMFDFSGIEEKERKLLRNTNNFGEDSESQHHVHEDVDHIIFQTSSPIDFTKFDRYIENSLPRNVIRAKGFLHFQNAPISNKKYLLQYVAGRKDWFHEEWDRERSTTVLFIGKGLEKELILGGLKACII